MSQSLTERPPVVDVTTKTGMEELSRFAGGQKLLFYSFFFFLCVCASGDEVVS